MAIIGAGWAGFNAALKAKSKGLKTALIEKNNLGGTCLNRGCIPTKTLLASAKIYNLAKIAKIFGIETLNPHLNLNEAQARKNKIIQQLRKGMESALGGVDFINEGARLVSENTIEIGQRQINAKSILIATGSRPYALKDIKFDGKKVISSDEILDLEELPGSLLIIGGGVIGCEFASLFSSFDCGVSVVELEPQLLPGMDEEIAKKIEIIFKKKGIKIYTKTDATTVDLSNYNLVLVCVGRAPNTEGLGLEEQGVKLEGKRILVDEYLKTNLPNIYAAGDCANETMLAHFAAYQGEIAAENIMGHSHPKKVYSQNIPSCIFTEPEIGSVGLTEKEVKSAGTDVKINRFDFLGSGMARILNETEGFIKILSDKKTGQVLGASIIGPRATELIGILTLAVKSRLKISELKEIIFPHPTLSEGIASALKEGYGI